ncbi:MAG: aspartate kinase [Fluviicola sp.]|jgi:hypothetical protein
MLSIGKITEEIIGRSPFLREAMTEDLINISSLARKIRPEIEEILGKEVKEGAVVMAIKRMSPGLYHRLNMKISNIIGEIGDYLVRSNLENYTYENTESFRLKQQDLLQIFQNESDAFYTVCRGVTETTIISSQSLSTLIKELFKTERMKSNTNDLASITVKLPSINSEVYGIYYYILKQLAWEGINIIEVVSTANEFTVVVKQENIDKAFKVLMEIKKNAS